MELPLVQRYAAAAAIAIHATHPRQTALVLTLELPMGWQDVVALAKLISAVPSKTVLALTLELSLGQQDAAALVKQITAAQPKTARAPAMAWPLGRQDAAALANLWIDQSK
jgi:hypothetical protein